MRLNTSRLAAIVGAVILALATASVSTAHADEMLEDYFEDSYEDPVPTQCGAGTADYCGTKPTVSCDWEFHIGVNPVTKAFDITLKKTNCKVTGGIAIYKDHKDVSTEPINCNAFMPYVGMPSGCRGE